MRIVIVRAGRENAEAFGRVHSLAWKQAYAGVFPREYIDGDSAEKRAAELLAGLGQESGFLALADAEPAWILKCRREADGAEITSVYVLEKFRGCGVGSALMRAASEAAGGRELRLWVLESNAAAIRFYERNGFMPSGARRSIERGGRYTQVEYRKNGR